MKSLSLGIFNIKIMFAGLKTSIIYCVNLHWDLCDLSVPHHTFFSRHSTMGIHLITYILVWGLNTEFWKHQERINIKKQKVQANFFLLNSPQFFLPNENRNISSII